MSELQDKLRTTVAELETELHGLDSVDDETRQVLQEAVREIRAALHDEEAADWSRDSMTERLADAACSFEDSHPTLTGILRRLVDGLAQMGI
jgi:hypothetical protein